MAPALSQDKPHALHQAHQPQRIAALDGLRAFSILLVAASHTLELLLGFHGIPGGLGVTIFFFISGFIITRHLLSEMAHVGSGIGTTGGSGISLPSFYIKRFFRLTPVLVVFVVLSYTLVAATGHSMVAGQGAAALLYYANYYGLYHDAAVSGAPGVVSPLAVTWSLAVEEHFYFIFPAVVLFFRGRLHALGRALLVFLLAVFVWRCVLVFGVGIDNLPVRRLYMATDTRLDSIAYGCLLSVWFECARQKPGGTATHLLQWLSRPSALVAAAVLMLLCLVIRGDNFRESARYSLQGMALMPLFAALFWAQRPLRPLRWLLENRLALYIGAVSYSFYLYHFLGLALAQLLWPEGPGPALLALAWALGIGMTLLSYYGVETPSRRFGAKLASRALVPRTA